jgi:hypothetical protein
MEKNDWLREALKPKARATELGPMRATNGVPKLSQFADADYWYLTSGIRWTPNDPASIAWRSITVPKGFVTDFASVPQVLWNVLPPTGRYSYAAIIHDYLYWFKPAPGERKAADLALKICMEEFEVSAASVFTIHSAVQLAGGSAWDGNTTKRKAGERRVLKVMPEDPTVSWTEWKSDSAHFDPKS